MRWRISNIRLPNKMVFILCSCLFSSVMIRAERDSAEGIPLPIGRALLIGINTYLSPNIRSLNGAVNDVETMAQVLSSRFGFSSRQIRILLDKEATREGILSALQSFVNQAGSRDMLYIHFSGHGSQVKDLNGDEVDGMDETIIPYDGRTGDIRDITDDEIGGILNHLKNPNLLIVLDSCHSGTATRSAGIAVRSISPDTRLDLYQKAAGSKRSAVPLISELYVLMTGAAANQRALDGPVEGRYCGLFSYALARTLSICSLSISPQALLTGVEKELERLKAQLGVSAMPDPQLEAPESRWNQPVFLFSPQAGPEGITETQEAAASRAWLEVRTSEPDQVLLINGLSMAALPGSTWAVYPPGEKEFLPGKAVGTARVTGLRGKDAIAGIESPGKTVVDQSRAVLIAPPESTQRIPIRLVSSRPDGSSELLKKLIDQLPAVTAVGPDQFARFVLEMDGDSCWVRGAGGLVNVALFPASDENRLLTSLRSLLTKSITTADLLALRNPFSMLELEVRVVLAGDRALQREGQRGIKVVGRVGAPPFRILRENQPRSRENSIQLEIRSSADAYLTIVDVDAQGAVNLLFPYEDQSKTFCPEGKVLANQAILIPDSLERNNLANFYWDCGPPAGTDTIQVFSSTDLETAQLIRRHILDIAAQSSGATASLRPALTSELQRELTRLTVSRDIKIAPLAPGEVGAGTNAKSQGLRGDWTTASVTVIVQD
jgi:hypothetical protein